MACIGSNAAAVQTEVEKAAKTDVLVELLDNHLA